MIASDKPADSKNQNQFSSAPAGLNINDVKQPPSPKPTQLPSEKPGFAKKSVTGRIIATIFGILLLLGGIAAGVLLVQQQQEIRERAAGSDECIKSPFCEFLDEPDSSGTYTAKSDISYVLISTKNVLRFTPGVTDNGCYRVTISKNVAAWSAYGKGLNCKQPTNIQVWVSGVK